jgi:hypothetical protein
MSRWRVAAAGASAALMVGLVGPTAMAAPEKASAEVVTTWNAIAARTIGASGLPVQVTSQYFAFTNIATYDAVVAIEGRYEPYNRLRRPHPRASSVVAAATAAHHTLAHYFPAAEPALDADYEASLASVPDGIAKLEGQRVGAAAAQVIIDDRANDGRDAPITLSTTPAPGVWRPTPPNNASMSSPWLGFVEPLAIRSPTQFKLHGPDSLSSKAYARDVAEARAYGSRTLSARTPKQTETALFWSVSPILQFQAGLRDHVTRHRLDIADSARAFAALSTANADALMSCWRAKYDDPFWRPVTAIREAGTNADPTWTPLVDTPPYPEYTSGHACVSGSTSEVLGQLFGRRSLDLNVSSTGPTPPTPITRHYDSARALDEETKNARIWLGIHFRRAMTDGNELGHRVATWTLRHRFQPTDC